MTDRTNLLKSGERIDDLQRNGLKIIQDPGRFCFGMDAVLLSGFASAGIRQGMRVLDLGTGTGIIPLLLSAKTQAESLCGLEDSGRQCGYGEAQRCHEPSGGSDFCHTGRYQRSR